MRHLFALFIPLAFTLSVAADETQFRPASRECVGSIDSGAPLAPLASDDSGQPRGDNSPFGVEYDVTHAVGSQVPVPGCFPPYAPGPPGPLDDIVLFDGLPDQTRRLVNNAIPVVTEQFFPISPEQDQIVIQTQSPPSAPLFPGGLIGPQGQPLTSGCFFIGLTAPLNYGGPKEVVAADITFLANGIPFAGPIDVSGPAFFSSPWDGTFGINFPGLAGTPVNAVVINIIVVRLGCLDDTDCDDGDPCTIDACIDQVCFNFPDPDPCCAIDCDDGNACTIDMCVNGLCVYALANCDDGDMCTVDTCDPGTGCVNKHLKDVLTREQALRASHGPSKPCFDSGGVPKPPPSAPVPDDWWQTNENCDGETRWRIGLDPGSAPLPADFFDPGSEPFTGEIPMKGFSLGLPDQANTDTIVRRSSDPFDRSSPPDGTDVTVEIELVELSLVSCQPITVTHSNGDPDTQWHVQVTLSECPPAPGTLTARKTHCNGGTFDSVLPVQPKVTFILTTDPAIVRVFDTGCDSQAFPPDVLAPPVPSAWVHDIANNLAVASNYASAFHAGMPEGQSTACGDYDLDNDADVDDFIILLKAYGSDASEPQYQYFNDYDADGDVDYDDYEEWLACYRCSTGNPIAGAPSPVPLADMNDDGQIRGDDLQSFVDCLVLGGPIVPPCDRADINQDGVVDFKDIRGFVFLLLELN